MASDDRGRSSDLINRLQTVLLIILGFSRSAYKWSRSTIKQSVPFVTIIIKLFLDFVSTCLLLTKETACMILFGAGPLALLVLVFSGAAIVGFFLRIAKKMRWREKTAHQLGLDVAALFMKTVFKFWHGQEFSGIENIPPRGGALIVWYHGPMPADYFALIAEVQYLYGRQIKSIMDKFLKKIPNSDFFIDKLGCSCEGREGAVKHLKDGELLGVAPGGSREALFCQDYSVQWGKRTGFAKVALEANVPIIPVFTENIREAYTLMRSLGFLWRYVYEAARLPVVPVWGGYPVKLITHIGTPIYPGPNETPETMRDKTKLAIEDMMRKHQCRNPSTWKALLYRIRPRHTGGTDTIDV